MKIFRENIKQSPYLGIFSTVTEEIALVPESTEQKEMKKLEAALEVEAIKASIASSSLIGILCKGNTNGFVVPEIAEKQEIKDLESKGLKFKVIKGNLALGNLIAVNEEKAVLSSIIPKKQREEIAKFLKVEAIEAKIAGNELVGSSMVLTSKGFLMNNKASQKEFDKIRDFLKLEGKATTANYGDSYIGNSIIANSKAIIAGSLTTNIEIMKIQEGLEN
ncbi:MAG: translation initiation factor IF-6 [Candidatus Diapherotrites archaeon]|nr:translation initiation factor IF-6 [Candidatus Diapherotrites archaeon]